MKKLLLGLLGLALASPAFAGGSTAPGIVPSGSFTSGHCYQVSAPGVTIDSGAACGTGTAGVTQSTGTASQILINGDALAHTGATTFTLPPGVALGTNGGTGGSLTLNGATSGSGVLQVPAAAGTGTVFQLPATNGTSGNLLVAQGSNSNAWEALNGDCTLTSAGAISCSKTNGTLFGTAATQNTGSSGATVPLLSTANTWSLAQTFSAAPILGSITGSTQCLHVNTAGTISGTGADCGAGGGGGTPGGTSGQVQFNNGGVFGGFTLGGDATLNTGTGALTIASNAINFAKFQQIPALSLVGNPTGGTANASSVSLGNGLTFCGTAVCPTAGDNTSTVNYTLGSIDMAGLRVMNGSSLTLTIPAISSTVFAQGMTSLFDNTNASNLAITTTPVINGLPNSTLLHQFGWADCVSNSTSLDCVGFPGFGTITPNGITKYIDSSGATTASSLVDNGTLVRSAEPVSVEANQSFAAEFPNAGTTGTTLNKLAKLNSGNAIIASTTDTDGELGIVIGGAGTTGSAQIAQNGTALCVFDAATTAGDFVGISSTTAGDCHDVGASRPLSTQTIGRVLSTNGAGGTFEVAVALGVTNTAGGGSGTVNSGTAGQMAYYATSTAAVSGNPNASISGAALTLGQAGTGGSLILSGATSGAITLQSGTASPGSVTASLPANTGTLAELNLAQSWTAGQAVTPTTGGTQSAGGTLTPDFSTSNSVTATFGAGNLTIANPTNVKAGQSYVIALTQDATGGRTVTWGANFKWAGGTAPTLSTGANAKDVISCWADTTTTINCTLAVKGAA